MGNVYVHIPLLIIGNSRDILLRHSTAVGKIGKKLNVGENINYIR